MSRAAMSRIRRFETAVRDALQGPCGGVSGPVVLAVSGGVDSLALLHALARIDNGSALHVAYFDHGLRAEAEVWAEREFVAAQAAALGLPFLHGREDVRAVARQQHRSIEDAARRCRYAFLARTARDIGAGYVATGHTASDQAETVLLRIVRGTGIEGLGGMDWRASWPLGGVGPVLIRPLLGLWRRDTAAYCDALGLTPRSDPENASARYTRNRMRHQILPLLRELNPRADAALFRLSETAREVQQLVRVTADAVWKAAVRQEDEGLVIDTTVLREALPAVRTEVLRRALALVDPEGLPPAHERLGAVERLALGGHHGVVELPREVLATRDFGAVRVRRGLPTVSRLEGSWPVAARGITHIPGWTLAVEPQPRPVECGEDRLTAWLRPELFADVVEVSTRRRGDRIAPVGMSGQSKSLHALLIEARVPRTERDALPVLRAGGRIAWVVGVRVAAWAAARPGEPAVRVMAQRVTQRYCKVQNHDVDGPEQPC